MKRKEAIGPKFGFSRKHINSPVSFMAMLIALFLVYVAFYAYAAAAQTSMQCNLTAAAGCSYTMVLYMENETGGYDNAHAQNVSEAGYAYGVCCNSTNGTIGVDCDTAFLKLSAVTNAHVQYPTVGTYSVDACISNALGKITVHNSSSGCGSKSTCMLSYASSESDNATNAHVSSCNYYGTQLCATLEFTPNTTAMTLNTTQGTNHTNENLDCYANVSDPDNSTIDVYWQWWKGTSLELSGAEAGISTDTLTLIATLASGNTSKGETWNCSVMAGDGTSNETWNNASLTILNTAPEHDNPVLNATSAYNFTSDNLRCWNVSTSDNDTADTVRNIVRWYQNNSKKDTLENFTTILSGNTSVDDSWICEAIPFDGTANGTARNSTALAIRDVPSVQVTKILDPALVVAGSNETLNVSTRVTNQKSLNITTINITDEIPWDFAYPQTTEVKVYFVNSTDTVALSTGVSISVGDADADTNIELIVNISNVSATEANTYLDNNNRIQVDYLMNSSKMVGNATRTVYTNVTIVSVYEGESSNSTITVINASETVLRGDKRVEVDTANPQMANVTIVVKALGGNLTEIALSDYLPQGATINVKDFRNVSYYNYTTGSIAELVNGTDYYVADPGQGTLPDGTSADIYSYNFSFYASPSNWDGTLYENDNITLSYNVSFTGGGTWVLPAIIGGWDPQYQKHIRTEMYPEASIPMFDILLDVLTKKIDPGSAVVAMLKMINVGGPKAKVDVFITYSAKTMEGELVTERSETMAVVDQKEKQLSLTLPSTAKPGMYTFEAFLTYTGREAMTTDVFEVTGEEVGRAVPGMEQYGIYIFLGIILVLILVLFKRTRGGGEGKRHVYRYKSSAKGR